jgi:hypothetical protein
MGQWWNNLSGSLYGDDVRVCDMAYILAHIINLVDAEYRYVCKKSWA